MKRSGSRPWTIIGLIAVTLALVFAGAQIGCTAEQLSAAAGQNPRLAPTTQAIEKAEKGVDRAAQIVIDVGPGLQAASVAASATGVPYAPLATVLLGGLISAAGMWIGHRNGSNSALATPAGTTLVPTGPAGKSP